ncbi:MAG: hypothetical protein KJ072_20145, partial [Verrucomicrobia bacterium]|nr:hypothetical protein [Verrucomicrobiota bacterium]
ITRPPSSARVVRRCCSLLCPGWSRAWSGYAFEGVCLKHASLIKAALGIAGVQTTGAPWRHPGSKTESGKQIDLLIDPADSTINIFTFHLPPGQLARWFWRTVKTGQGA